MYQPRYDLAIALFSVAMAVSCFLCGIVLSLATDKAGYIFLLFPASLFWSLSLLSFKAIFLW